MLIDQKRTYKITWVTASTIIATGNYWENSTISYVRKTLVGATFFNPTGTAITFTISDTIGDTTGKATPTTTFVVSVDANTTVFLGANEIMIPICQSESLYVTPSSAAGVSTFTFCE